MTALEKWKNDFKEFISELSIPRDDYKGIMEYIDEVPNEALEQQPCEDCISRQAIKRKLQEHHDFFIHAYGGFSNMPQNDKSRVDEITNCIAMIVNEPSATPKEKTGRWETTTTTFCGRTFEVIKCSCCKVKQEWFAETKFCPNCGAKMSEPQESEEV